MLILTNISKGILTFSNSPKEQNKNSNQTKARHKLDQPNIKLIPIS